MCESLRVCLHVFWCVSECVCFNPGCRGHIIKTSHFTGIPFTPYCLPHCWKIQVIYQSIHATCVLFPMCFYALSALCVPPVSSVHYFKYCIWYSIHLAASILVKNAQILLIVFSLFLFSFLSIPSSLSTDQGLNLMELLAERVSLHVTDFLQLS